MIQLLQYLATVHPMTADLEQAVRMALKVKDVPRGKHWLKEGEVSNHIAFIETGLMKMYRDVGSKEAVMWFNKEWDAIISVKSFFKRVPSRLAIQAIEDTRVWYADWADLQRLYEKYASFNVNGRVITEEYYCISEDHVMLMHLPAPERYVELLRLFPWMEGRITDKDMAAYLGVTPRHFCRFKGKVRG